jgi:hypothetical protein
MRSKPSTRYFCDFCNKGGNSASAMARHERHCTLNPQRECRMCQLGEVTQQPMADLLGCLRTVCDDPKWHSDDCWQRNAQECLEQLKKLADGCPACILAAIRQHGMLTYMFDYDYPKEAKSWLADANEARDVGPGYGSDWGTTGW